MVSLLLCLVAASLAAAGAGHDVEVRLPDGSRLLGAETATSRTGRPVYEFRGVRYASAPGGPDRFKPSQPTGPLGIYNATMFAPPCPPAFPWSNDWFTDPDAEVRANIRNYTEGEQPEDCLFLNVFTPTLDPGATLAVLVHIHGGSYVVGTSLLARPGFMLEHDLLLVTVQYRLFTPGFLYLGTDDAPGNMGLADLVSALRWVRNNIASFGGDPDRVTVSGGSAGAAAAELLAYSPLASGLFHQLLPMSGSAFAPWAMATPENALRAAQNIAHYARCNTTDVAKIAACLRHISLQNLTEAYMNHAIAFSMMEEGTLVRDAPVVHQKQLHSEPVLPLSPQELCAPGSGYRGRPMMTGVAKHDGHFFISRGMRYLQEDSSKTQCIYQIKAFLETTLKSPHDPVIAEALYAKFFNGCWSHSEMVIALTDFIGASKFKGPMIKSANCNAKHGGKTYVYTLSHRGSYSNEGIEHGIDVLYLSPRSDFKLSEEDELVSRRLVHLHANFIMYGDPTPNVSHVDSVPEWPAYKPDGGAYMRIDWPFRVKRRFEENEFDVTRREGFGSGATPGLHPATAALLVVAALRALCR